MHLAPSLLAEIPTPRRYGRAIAECPYFSYFCGTDVKVAPGLMEALLPCTVATLSKSMKEGLGVDGGRCEASLSRAAWCGLTTRSPRGADNLGFCLYVCACRD